MLRASVFAKDSMPCVFIELIDEATLEVVARAGCGDVSSAVDTVMEMLLDLGGSPSHARREAVRAVAVAARIDHLDLSPAWRGRAIRRGRHMRRPNGRQMRTHFDR